MRLLLIILSLALGACSPTSPLPESHGASGESALRVTGELRSANSRFFGPPAVMSAWHYRIAFMAPDGAPVKTGQPILRFDDRELQNKLRDKNNSLNEKQKQLKKQMVVSREQLAELKLAIEAAKAERDKAVLKAKIPESLLARREHREYQLTLELADITLKLRQAELEKEAVVQVTEQKILEREIGVLKAQIASLRRYIGSMTIFAPSDGVVIHASNRRGNKPSVGDTVGRANRVLEFPDLAQLEVHLEIPEREWARVTVGQEVGFILDAVPERRFEGKITALASVIRSKSTNQPMRIFDARVELQNPDPELMRPGMSITGEIRTGEEG